MSVFSHLCCVCFVGIPEFCYNGGAIEMGKVKEDISLASRQCGSCREGVCPLEADCSAGYLERLCDGWVINEGKLEKKFKFKNFRQALEKVNAIGALAEEQGHHPDMFLAWGKVEVTLFTHKVGGLTEDDFIFAAKIDQLSA
jgi:4a-hydroxytetrahydrobiopterin dehydratase